MIIYRLSIYIVLFLYISDVSAQLEILKSARLYESSTNAIEIESETEKRTFLFDVSNDVDLIYIDLGNTKEKTLNEIILKFINSSNSKYDIVMEEKSCGCISGNDKSFNINSLDEIDYPLSVNKKEGYFEESIVLSFNKKYKKFVIKGYSKDKERLLWYTTKKSFAKYGDKYSVSNVITSPNSDFQIMEINCSDESVKSSTDELIHKYIKTVKINLSGTYNKEYRNGYECQIKYMSGGMVNSTTVQLSFTSISNKNIIFSDDKIFIRKDSSGIQIKPLKIKYNNNIHIESIELIKYNNLIQVFKKRLDNYTSIIDFNLKNIEKGFYNTSLLISFSDGYTRMIPINIIVLT